MEHFDVVVLGGGIAGSVASRYTAMAGLETLLVEKQRTPRDKVCSGVQLPYMEKLLGAKIPRDRLCSNELHRVELTTPSGNVHHGRIKMLNYWRREFDDWLNRLAMDAGAKFKDGVNFFDFKILNNGFELLMNEQRLTCNYLIGADGLSPSSLVRRKLTPNDFGSELTGTAINYYFQGSSDIAPDTLHVYYTRNYSNLMFSWLYYKDDLLVIGTSSKENIKDYIERYFKRVSKEHNLNGKIVRKEGYSTTFTGGINLGINNLLLVGDAAGLLDLYRGEGMDTASISGRLAAKAITMTDGITSDANYLKLSNKLIKTLQRNNKRQSLRYTSNEKLERSLSSYNLIKGRITMTLYEVMNYFLPIEKMYLLPP